jgi:hypothetical protein
MLRTLSVLSFATVIASAGDVPLKELSARAIIDHRMPSFRNGYLYVVDPANIITVFAPDGHQLVPISISGKGHGQVSIQSLAIDTDGTLAIGWTDAPDAGIDFRDQFGNLIRTMDTGKYIASDLAFGEGHTLWALGFQRDPVQPDMAEKGDYPTVRKYAADGSTLGAYLPKSLFLPGLEPGTEKPERSITVTPDRVGVEVISGHRGNEQEWVELDLNGSVQGRWKLDPSYHAKGVAFTSDNQAYIELHDAAAKTYHVYRLNHATGTWELVTSPGGHLSLYGADGTSLVFGRWPDGVMHLSWFSQGQVLTASK